MGSRMAYRFVWIPSLIGLVAVDVMFAMRPMAIPKVGSLVTYEAADKSFRLKHPDNWKPHGMSLHETISDVSFEPGKGVYFVVSTDTKGSLMADIAKSNNTMMGSIADMAAGAGSSSVPTMPTDSGGGDGQDSGSGIPQAIKEAIKKSPLQSLHEKWGHSLAEVLDGYKEEPARKSQLSGLEAFVTDYKFNGKGTWGPVPFIGRRITLLSNDRQIKVRYDLAETAAKELEPVVQKMVGSLQVGEQGGAR